MIWTSALTLGFVFGLKLCELERINIKYSKYTWIPENLIQDAISNKWEISLAYFILLRGTYKNNTFYNFTYRSLEAKTGISFAVLSRHIKRLKDKGLISIHNGNLSLTGSRKLAELYDSKLIPIKQSQTKKEIILNIQFTRVLRNLNSQHFVVNRLIGIKKLQKQSFITYKQAKKLIKYKRENNTERLTNDYYILSNRKFGSLNNRSQSTGLNIQKRMNDSGLIISKRNVLKCSDIKTNKRGFYNMCLPSKYMIGSDCFIYKSLPNKINIPMQ